jgi:hypothetical protein
VKEMRCGRSINTGIKAIKTSSRPALVWLLALVLPMMASSESCETVDKIPADAKQVANGVVSSSAFSTSFVGGQRVYVKVRNDTVHLTPATITIAEGKSTHEYCSSTIATPPQKTLIFSTAVFGERINWGVRVEAGDVDVVQLSVNVYSTPPQKP